MKQAPNLLDVSNSITRKIKHDYDRLLEMPALSITRLLSSPGVSLAGFSRGFTPHPRLADLKADANAFIDGYHQWLDPVRPFVNCAGYLFPGALYDRLLLMTNSLSIGFYLNDVMGRDVFPNLSIDDQQAAMRLIDNMSLVTEDLDLASDAHPLEIANTRILEVFKEQSPDEWFSRWLKLFCYHLSITHRDRNTRALGYIPGVHEYMDVRCHYAAVHHLILWVEYCTDNYVDWRFLTRTNLLQKMERLHWTTAAFPALANDLFSFEQEVIDNQCDSNLIMVILLNHPEWPLGRAIEAAAEIVQNILFEQQALTQELRVEIDNYPPSLSAEKEKLIRHLDDLMSFTKASWLWQFGTKRYKRPKTIWLETALSKAPTGEDRGEASPTKANGH